MFIVCLNLTHVPYTKFIMLFIEESLFWNKIKEGLASEKTAVDNKKIFTISSHLEEQAKIRNEIRWKRKSV